MTPEQEKLFQESLKNPDTEERIDIIFYRRLGFRIALLAEKLGITPNAITIASIFVGIGAGLCFLSTNLCVNVAGMLLLILADAFDSADGQLARLTKQYSRLGRILDGVAGDLWFASIYVCICIRVNHSIPFFMEHSWLIWTLAVCAGLCHALQAAMADYYRQLHLQCVNGKSELEDINSLRQSKQGLVQNVYYYYSMLQVRVTRNMQTMRRTLAERFPDGNIPQELRDQFRALSLPLMPLTNILSFNWRAITLFISLFLRLPWLYFVVELTIGNALLIYMICRHERICKIVCRSPFLVSTSNEQRKTKNDIKGIIFDYGGTIDSRGVHWSEVIWDAYKVEQVSRPATPIAQVTKEQFRDAYVYAERYLAKNPVIQPQDNFLALMQKKIRIELEHLGIHDEATANSIASSCYESARECVEEARLVLEALSQKYPMVLVSNFYGNVSAVLADFDLLKYFPTIVESAVVGVRKPDPAIFQLGVDALHLPANEVLVVGDSLRKDILPAESIGCQTAWLKGKGWTADEDAQTHPSQIRSLKDLVDCRNL